MIRSGWGSRLPRRLLLTAAVAALVPVIAGCEAGDNAPTLQFHYPTDAAGTVVGGLSISNVFVLGAPLGSALPAGGSASLFFALVNQGPSDRLVSITAPGTATSVQLSGGTVAVPTAKPVFFTGPQPEAVLSGLTRTLTGGSDITLIMTFQNAGPVTLQVPVMARAQHYVTYAPPSPTPSPTTTPGHHKAKPSATVTPTPSAS